MAGTKERDYLRAVLRATAAIASGAAPGEVLASVVRGVARVMQAGASVAILDSGRKKLVHCVSWGLPRAYLQKGVLDASHSLADVLGGKTVAIADVTKAVQVQYPELAAQAGISSMLGVPITIDGVVAGSLRVYARQPTDFTRRDINFVTIMAHLAAVALSRETEQREGERQNPVAPLVRARVADFAHPSEEEFARILDFYNIEWVYEPQSFPLAWEGERVTEMFTPDFYLPGLDLFVELTTLKQRLVTEKNRKLRRLRELHPEIRITLLYKKDFDRLLAKFGYGPLAEARGRGVTRVLYSSAAIQQRVHELAEQISTDYGHRRPIMVGVLRGVFCFMADLIRQMVIPLDVEFMAISYYGGGDGSVVKITKDIDLNVAGRDVIMVEDIVDTGMTLNYMINHLRAKGPASLAVCALLDKRARRIADMPLDYVGFEVPDEFVVGYGLDYREEYRNLPFIGVVGTEEISPGKEETPEDKPPK